MKLNTLQAKLRWSDDDMRTLLKLTKTHTVKELASYLRKSESAIINQCSRMGCGYHTK